MAEPMEMNVNEGENKCNGRNKNKSNALRNCNNDNCNQQHADHMQNDN